MSLPITRNTPAHLSYDDMMKRADRRGVLAVAAFTLVLLVVALAPAIRHSLSVAVRSAAHAGAAAGSHLSNVPLDAAFVAIIGVVVVAIGLAVRERLADEDREVFDVR